MSYEGGPNSLTGVTQPISPRPHPPTDQPPAAERPTQILAAGPAGAGSAPPPSRPERDRRRSRKLLVPLVIGLVLGLGAVAAFVFVTMRGVDTEDAPEGFPQPTGKVAELPAGRTWLSGAWSGGGINAERINGFGAWRGQSADVATTYPAYETWDELRESEWHVNTFDGFKGRLAYGLPMLPKNGEGSLGEVADGKYDDVWASIADTLVEHNRGDTFVRIGLEANGTWFDWGATAERAERFKAAYQQIQKVMSERAPDLVFVFDITCGKALEGGSDRMDSLTKLYPGDEYVDVIGCDHYDSYTVKSRNQDEWQNTLRPEKAAGLADVADFARERGKQLAVPEWGLTASGQDDEGKNRDGAGDNPFFIYSMYGFFQQNKDILAFENYFNEPENYLESSIWDPVQHPKASAEYRKLWGAPPAKLNAAS